MIFSGGISFYRCEACASEYSNFTPTSLLPITAVVALATTAWARVLSRVVLYKSLSVILAVIVAIASLWAIYSMIDTLTTGKLRRGMCPECGAKLKRTGSGFYEGIAPNLWELVIYALVIALAFGVAMATRPST